jgi:hypothetical protein
MAAKTEYQKKLLSPLWQKKRLEIFERDKWKCRLCEDEEATLNVHHLKYMGYGAHPADSPNEDLITYCEDCHFIVEIDKKFTVKKIKKMYHDSGNKNLLLYVYGVASCGTKGIFACFKTDGVYAIESMYGFDELLSCIEVLKTI